MDDKIESQEKIMYINLPFQIDSKLSELINYYGEPTLDTFYMGGRLVMFEKVGYFLGSEVVTGFMIGSSDISIYNTYVGMTPHEISIILSEPVESHYNEAETQSYIYIYHIDNYSVRYESDYENGPTTHVIIMGNTKEPTQEPTPTHNNVQPTDAAKLAADVDNFGWYFLVYNYDTTNYLVSAYESQQGPGNYVRGGGLYLVNKSSGKLLIDSQIDFNKVDFSKYLAVYSKLSGKIIE